MGSFRDIAPISALDSEYDIERDLGRGGFSLVQEVHRKGAEAGITTACKITPIKTLIEMGREPKEMAERMQRLKALSDSTNSPHILRFLDWRFSEHDAFGFFEIAKGGDLFTRIVDSPDEHLSEDDARRATFGLLEGIKEYQEVGLMHRDIKCENLLYRQPTSPIDEVVIADFGACLEGVEEGQMFVDMAGTPGYMAPEMAAGLPYDMKIDIFSAGVCAYEMCTGRSPFVGQDPQSLLEEVVERKIPYPKAYWSKMSAEAKDCVKCMLHKDPRDRWSAEELLSHPWFASLPPPKLETEEYKMTKRKLRAQAAEERIISMLEQARLNVADSDEEEEDGWTSSEGLTPRTTSLAVRKTTAAKPPQSAGGVFETEAILEGKVSQRYTQAFQKLDK